MITEFWVIDATSGHACSTHKTRALAVAKIPWYWKKVYPSHSFYVEEIRCNMGAK